MPFLKIYLEEKYFPLKPFKIKIENSDNKSKYLWKNWDSQNNLIKKQ